MKYTLFLLPLLLSLSSEGNAVNSIGNLSGGFSNAFAPPPAQKGPTMVMNAGVTYGVESFDISIGFANRVPNVLSTLEWKNIHVVGASVNGEGSIKGFPVLYEGFYGVMREGKGKFVDKDYAGNNKTLLWSHTDGKVVGSAIDISLGAALMKAGDFRALAGILFTQRNYELRNNKQIASSNANWTILGLNQNTAPAAVGTVFKGKNGTYKMKVYGPWVGGDMMLNVMEGFNLKASVKGVYGFYKAAGVWPSHSFEDKSKAYGAQGKVGVSGTLFGVDLFADVGMKYYKVKKGSVKTSKGILIDFFRGGTFKSYMATVGGRVPL